MHDTDTDPAIPTQAVPAPRGMPATETGATTGRGVVVAVETALGLGALLTAATTPTTPNTLVIGLCLLGLSVLPTELTLNTHPTGPPSASPAVVFAAVLLLPAVHVAALITLLHLHRRARGVTGQPAGRATRPGAVQRWWQSLAEVAVTALASTCSYLVLTHTATLTTRITGRADTGPVISGIQDALAAGPVGAAALLLAATTYLTIGSGVILIGRTPAPTTPDRPRSRSERLRPGVLHHQLGALSLAVLVALTLTVAPLLVLLTAPISLLLPRGQHAAHLARAASRDDKTGLLNSSTWHATAATALAQRTHPTGVIIVDLDHFKQINDTHGHPAGDAVLTAVATALTRSARAGDSVARYGGDEFLVLLPKTTPPTPPPSPAASTQPSPRCTSGSAPSGTRRCSDTSAPPSVPQRTSPPTTSTPLEPWRSYSTTPTRPSTRPNTPVANIIATIGASSEGQPGPQPQRTTADGWCQEWELPTPSDPDQRHV